MALDLDPVCNQNRCGKVFLKGKEGNAHLTSFSIILKSGNPDG